MDYLSREKDTSPLTEHLYEVFGEAQEEALVVLEKHPGELTTRLGEAIHKWRIIRWQNWPFWRTASERMAWGTGRP